jgi:hypothetical protein
MYSLPERDLVGNLPVRSAAAHSLRETMKVSAVEGSKGQSGRGSEVSGRWVSVMVVVSSIVSERGVSSVLLVVSSNSCDEREGGAWSRGVGEDGKGEVLLLVGGGGGSLLILRVVAFTAADGCGFRVDRMCCRIRSMCPFAVAIVSGLLREMISPVSPGMLDSHPARTALRKVEVVGDPKLRWWELTKVASRILRIDERRKGERGGGTSG